MGGARFQILQRDLSSLNLPSTLTMDLKRPLPMRSVGRIVAHLMILDDFKGSLEIEDLLLQRDGQQRPRLGEGQGRCFFFTFRRMRTKKWWARKVWIIW